MRTARTDRSIVGRWWQTIDRTLLGSLLLLVAFGLVLAFASSPAVAIRKGLPPFHFAERQIVFAAVGIVVMLTVSLLSPRTLRRLALALFVAGIAAMVVVLMAGEEINGARRWLRLAGFSLQPSEIAKPGFAVLTAWAFSESERRPDMPGLTVAVLLLGLFATLLVMQPDIGQTLLVAAVWSTLFLLAVRSRLAAVLITLAGAVGVLLSYFAFPHVRLRIDRFLAPGQAGTSQVERAWQSFAEGGLFGRGAGEGSLKAILPDAHTDFVFAVLAEEFGAIACLALLALLATIVLRPLLRAASEEDAFVRNASVALALLLGMQALINLGSNVGLLPAKGMTLPFVSTGGSSLIAVSIAAGMLVALTRRRPSRHAWERRETADIPLPASAEARR